MNNAIIKMRCEMFSSRYSSTVYDFYDENQDWWHENCANENDLYDRDGFDMYGYDNDGFDRAGNTEDYYRDQEWFDENFSEDEWRD